LTSLAFNFQKCFRFLAGNKIGFISGIAYSIFSVLAFFAGLGYGASCPELGPDVCANPLLQIVVVSSMVTFFGILPHMITWSIVFFIGQQISVLVSPIPNNTSPDFTPLVIGISILVAGLWGMFGAWVQRSIRNRALRNDKAERT
jgi:hypothetical protein